MSIKHRLEKIEQQSQGTDELVQQAKDVWSTIGETLTDEQAEHIAQSYRDRGLTEITWASLMRVDPNDVKGFL